MIFWCSVISLCFFCFQLFFIYLKIAFFKKGVQNLVFSIFSVLSYFFENSLFLGWLKHYKNRVSADFGVFCFWKRRNRQKKDNWNLQILGFLVQKRPFRDTQLLFKKRPWNPYFYSVFWVRAFWAKVSKKGNFEKPPKKKENLTDNWKAIFGVFAVFLLGGSFFFFFVFVFLVFLFVFCFCVFLEGLRVRWGGPKGHLTWPLTLLISFFLFFCFFCFFVFVVFVVLIFFWFCFLVCLIQKKPCFSQKRAFFVYFQSFSFFLP